MQVNKQQINYVIGFLFSCKYERQFQEFRLKLQKRIANNGINQPTVDGINNLMAKKANQKLYNFTPLTLAKNGGA